MIELELTGSVDPILKAKLAQGDVLCCESDAMVAMDEVLSLTGKTRGGFFSSLSRRFLNDESFFQQQVTAEKGAGEVLLSPLLAGDVRVLDVGPARYCLADSSYLANTEGVTLETKSQGLGKALFAKTGAGLKGFFCSGSVGRGEPCGVGFRIALGNRGDA